MPIFIPNLFGAYIDGRREAIKDNWLDQTNFNNVLKGQLDNALTMDTYDPSVRTKWNDAAKSDMDVALAGAYTDNMLEQNDLEKLLGLNKLIVNRRYIDLLNNIGATQRELDTRALEDSAKLIEKTIQNKSEQLDNDNLVIRRNANTNQTALDVDLDKQLVENSKRVADTNSSKLQAGQALLPKELEIQRIQLDTAIAQLKAQLSQVAPTNQVALRELQLKLRDLDARRKALDEQERALVQAQGQGQTQGQGQGQSNSPTYVPTADPLVRLVDPNIKR